MYVSAAGQLEYPPGFNPANIPAEPDERPAKRQKKDGSAAKTKGMPERPDAHEKAPEALKSLYKKWQKAQKHEMKARMDLIEMHGDPKSVRFPKHILKEVPAPVARDPFAGFLGVESQGGEGVVKAYEVRGFPGLLVYPSLLPPPVQLRLLDKLLHRDLSNPEHQANVHLHHNLTYPSPTPSGEPGSFFSPEAQDLVYTPKASHSTLSTSALLAKKLRWMTLGGQYDWTNKAYPSGPPPPFPPDIAKIISGLFPMKAEAAIVNLYSPGDTLSAHRDVSEACAQPLVSISLGCDAVFLVGLEEEITPPEIDPEDPNAEIKMEAHQKKVEQAKGRLRTAVLRLKSGDAVLMSGRSRYAWHGVPKVLPDTCPEFMQDWPAVGEGSEEFEGYKGWMGGKRVNLNVRQMFATSEEETATDAVATAGEEEAADGGVAGTEAQPGVA